MIGAVTAGLLLPTAAPATPAAPTAPAAGVASAGIVASNLDTPWGIARLPGGGALIGERDSARLLFVRKNGKVTAVTKIPGVVPTGPEGGEGGLLGLAITPNFRKNHWLYAYTTTASDNRVIRMKFRNGKVISKPQVIFSGISTAKYHNGGGLAFGPDKMLYVSTGDASNRDNAQNRSSLNGKILRMRANGLPARGNPFGNSVVYAMGLRNPQGLAWDSTRRLWATEFGENDWDELNLIRSGGNYGWPVVEGRSSDRRFINPAVQWTNDFAGPSGLAIRGQVAWVGALTGKRLYRVPLSGAGALKPTAYLTDRFGRLRTPRFAPDGTLWVTTSNRERGAGRPMDQIIRLRVS